MTRLFQRAGVVTVDEIELTIDPADPGGSLDVSFDVFRTTKPEPNTADIQIWNMTPENRFLLEEQGNVPVQIEAGYKDATSLLFLGIARTVFTVREGADIITTLQSGDGEKEYQRSRINVSIAKGATNQQALDAIVKALAVGDGNAPSLSAKIAASPPLYPQGTVLTGSAAQILQRFTESLGLEFSIQNGALQILEAGTPLQGTATELTSETGMVGAPSVDNEGVLSVTALLIPEIFPGRLLKVESEFLSGNFRVESCRYTGSTFDNDWYVDVEAQKL